MKALSSGERLIKAFQQTALEMKVPEQVETSNGFCTVSVGFLTKCEIPVVLLTAKLILFDRETFFGGRETGKGFSID